MKYARKLTITAAAVSLATLMAVPVMGAGASTARATAKNTSIVFIPGMTTDPFFLAMQLGEEAAAAKLHIYVQWTGASTYSFVSQTQVFNATVANHPGGIIFASTDKNAMNGPAAKAYAKGIKLMTVDSTISQANLLATQIYTSNLAGGKMAADALAKLIGNKGDVAILNQSPGITTGDQRQSSFIQEMKTAHPNVKVVTVQYNGGSITKSASQAQSILEAYPGIKGIFAINDSIATGAIAGLTAAHKLGKVKLVAYDAEPAEVTALAAGQVSALIVQKPELEAQLAVDQMYAVLTKGTMPPSSVQILNPVLATKANMNNSSVSKWFYPAA
jgi:ribose transport system substrate-binding protein